MRRRDFLRLAALAGVGTACRGATTPRGAPSPPRATPTGASSTPSAVLLGRWRRLRAAGLPPRRDHTVTGDPGGESAWVFGGRDDEGARDDLWRLDLGTETWEPLDARGPGKRFGHNAALLDGTLVVFGGQAGPSEFLNDVWGFDIAARRWARLHDGAGRAPRRRYGAGGTAVEGALLVSHGFTNSGRFDDTWAFAGSTWMPIAVSGDVPVKRCLHRIAATGAREVLLFGGQTNGTPFLGDTWRLDLRSLQWTKHEGRGPSPRTLYAMASTNGIHLFGGEGPEGVLGDTWHWSGGGWRRLDLPGGPPPRGGVDGTLAGGNFLVVGGRDAAGTHLGDAWVLRLA